MFQDTFLTVILVMVIGLVLGIAHGLELIDVVKEGVLRDLAH